MIIQIAKLRGEVADPGHFYHMYLTARVCLNCAWPVQKRAFDALCLLSFGQEGPTG